MFDEVEDGMTVDAALSAYDYALDEIYGSVEIAGHSFDTSRALRGLDPIAYRVGFHDYLDGEGVDSDTLTGEWDNVP